MSNLDYPNASLPGADLENLKGGFWLVKILNNLLILINLLILTNNHITAVFLLDVNNAQKLFANFFNTVIMAQSNGAYDQEVRILLVRTISVLQF